MVQKHLQRNGVKKILTSITGIGRLFFLLLCCSGAGLLFADTKYYVVTDTASGYQFEVREKANSGFSKCVAYSIHQLPEKARLSVPGTWTRSLACTLKPKGCLGDGEMDDSFIQIALWQDAGDREDSHNMIRMLRKLRRLTGSRYYPNLVKKLNGHPFHSIRYSFETLDTASFETGNTGFLSGFNGEWIELPSADLESLEFKQWNLNSVLTLFSSPHREIRWHTDEKLSDDNKKGVTQSFTGASYYFYKESRKKKVRNPCKKSMRQYYYSTQKKEHPLSGESLIVLMLLVSSVLAFYQPPDYMY